MFDGVLLMKRLTLCLRALLFCKTFKQSIT
nr:MAG TPA: hypothetical protein [Bacteriophage sp.]